MKFILIYIFSLIFGFRLAAQDTTLFNKQSVANSTSFPRIEIFNKRYYSVDENNLRSAEALNFSITMIKVNNFSLLKNVPPLNTALEKTKKISRERKVLELPEYPFACLELEC